jgi:hypothetical protein
MAVNQKRISNVARNHRQFVHIDIVNIVYDMDSSALRCIGWLNNPDVLLAVMLLELLVVLVELSELIRQDVGVRHEVEMLLPKSVLHPHHIKAETIFASDLVTLREMVDFLVLV